MRAVLLAGGLGTRLRPLTDEIPKCLVEVGGRSLLDHWLDAFARAGFSDVLVNTHHLPELVERHLRSRAGRAPTVTVAHEPQLLGSAGTLLAARAFLGGHDFVAVNADNLTDFDITRLVRAHRDGGAIATLATFHTPTPSRSGILQVDDGVVTGFDEKPAAPRGDLANAGMYAFSPAVLDLIDVEMPQDIGYHLVPRLVGRARAVDIGDAYLADIGTHDALAQARHDWSVRQEVLAP